MAEPLADMIIRKIDQIVENYYRLLVVVAPSGAGKTAALQDVQAKTGIPLININLELSQQMLDLTERQRALKLPQILSAIVGKTRNNPPEQQNDLSTREDVLLLDNIEILFDVSLKQDPLRLLENLSRNKTLVVSWNGSVDSGYITYATPDHAEYKRYPIRDFAVAGPGVTE